MKKTIILTALVAFLFGTINTISAHDDSRRQEFMARQTERLVKNLKLDGDKKTQFEAIYKRYQEELAATRQQQARQRDDDNNKNLSDEEATAKLTEIFARQAEQIQQQQRRLDIQQKYCAELSAILTPQQLLQVFQPQGRQGGRQGQGGRGGFGGGSRGGGFGGGGDFGGAGF
jgi:Spy/CpxP family protein refolding chaperone